MQNCRFPGGSRSLRCRAHSGGHRPWRAGCQAWARGCRWGHSSPLWEQQGGDLVALWVNKEEGVSGAKPSGHRQQGRSRAPARGSRKPARGPGAGLWLQCHSNPDPGPQACSRSSCSKVQGAKFPVGLRVQCVGGRLARVPSSVPRPVPSAVSAAGSAGGPWAQHPQNAQGRFTGPRWARDARTRGQLPCGPASSSRYPGSLVGPAFVRLCGRGFPYARESLCPIAKADGPRGVIYGDSKRSLRQ